MKQRSTLLRVVITLLVISVCTFAELSTRLLASAAPLNQAELTNGYHEQESPAITYSGNWQYMTDAGASGGTFRRSNDPAARATFQFNGTKLTIVALKYFNRGKAEICIDGACTVFDAYSSGLQWQFPIVFNVASGTHTVTIRNLSSNFIDLDAVRVEGSGAVSPTMVPTAAPTTAPTTAPSSALSSGFYEQETSTITYSGNWQYMTDAGASGGTFRRSNDPAARATFQFSGTKLTIVALKYFNRGKSEICIDGACTVFDAYSSGLQWQFPIVFNVANGTHSVTIRNLSSNFIDLDAVRVESSVAALPTAAPIIALPAPVLVDPANGAQIAYSAQPFTYNWDAVSGAVGYHIQIATDSNFANLVYDTMPTSDGWAAQSPFNGGTYYWRVRARSASGSGAWSAARSVVISTPTPTPTAPQFSPMAYRTPYTATSPWNTPIGANPAYDRYSSQMISLWGTNATGGRITSDTTQYTYPVYFADKNTPRYNIPCVKYKCSVVDDAGNVTRVTSIPNVPIPNGAQQSAGTDAQMIIIDSETGAEYGFYEMYKQADGSWQAGNGYRYHMNYTGSTPGFGSRGAGVPYYAGLIRAHEIRNGEIKHAIAFVYQFTAVKGCVYPATMTDGKNTNAYAIPEGARIQLNPNLTDADFDRMGLSRAGKIVARAMQKYGLILIDSGGSSKIIAENLSANTLYGESWNDADLQYTKNVVYNIPVTEFRVLALPDGYHNAAAANWGKCVK